jgi:hypothetical protein
VKLEELDWEDMALAYALGGLVEDHVPLSRSIGTLWDKSPEGELTARRRRPV